jgi:hypothetical protein
LWCMWQVVFLIASNIQPLQNTQILVCFMPQTISCHAHSLRHRGLQDLVHSYQRVLATWVCALDCSVW